MQHRTQPTIILQKTECLKSFPLTSQPIYSTMQRSEHVSVKMLVSETRKRGYPCLTKWDDKKENFPRTFAGVCYVVYIPVHNLHHLCYLCTKYKRAQNFQCS